MRVRRRFLLPIILVFTAMATLGQTPKQELNDKFWEAVRKGDLATVTSLLDRAGPGETFRPTKRNPK
jgi:hypothetical protein